MDHVMLHMHVISGVAALTNVWTKNPIIMSNDVVAAEAPGPAGREINYVK